MKNALYTGAVLHKRLQPFRHRFVYRVFSLLLDLEALPQLRFFKHNRFGLLSFYDRDHGPRDGSPLKPWLEAQLRAHDIDPAGLSYQIMCYPRLWGFVFNPLSVYYARDAAGTLRAIVYEVKNTFGGQHTYVFRADAVQSCAKSFYVSPFIGPVAQYHFKFNDPAETVLWHIQEHDPQGPLLIATFAGQRSALTDGAILKAIATHPLMTVKVVAAIHWQALRIWLKGGKYHAPPKPQSKPNGGAAT